MTTIRRSRPIVSPFTRTVPVVQKYQRDAIEGPYESGVNETVPSRTLARPQARPSSDYPCAPPHRSMFPPFYDPRAPNSDISPRIAAESIPRRRSAELLPPSPFWPPPAAPPGIGLLAQFENSRLSNIHRNGVAGPLSASISYDPNTADIIPSNSRKLGDTMKDQAAGSVENKIGEDKYLAALAYQEEVAVSPPEPLAAKSPRKATQSARTKDTHDQGHGAQSNTAHQVSSRDSRDDGLTIKVFGGAVVRISDTEIKCDGGGDVTLGLSPSDETPYLIPKTESVKISKATTSKHGTAKDTNKGGKRDPNTPKRVLSAYVILTYLWT